MQQENGQFLSSFETLCKNVFVLLIKQQIPMDIKVRFEKMTEIDRGKDLETIFYSYFDKEKLNKEFKKPQCDIEY